MNFSFYRNIKSNVSLCIIIIITIINYILACNSGGTSNEKRKTSSLIFTKLKSNSTSNCRFINDSFDQIDGIWNIILRTTDSRKKLYTRCEKLIVTATSKTEFKATIFYIEDHEKVDGFLLTGNYVNETTVEIPEYKRLITGNPHWIYPLYVQIGVCDNNSLVFMEPIYYRGGGIVLAREIPENIAALQKRFATFDEGRGIEITRRDNFDCILRHRK